MSGRRLPEIDPLTPNAVGPFDEFTARAFPVLDYNDYPGIEFSLGMLDIRCTRPIRRNHVLNCHFCSFSLKY